MQKFTVEFDSGEVIETEVRSRDLVKLEEAGLDLQALPPMRGSYTLAHAALLRMERAGKITPGVVPATVEGLMDVADIVADEDPDRGEGSGQVVSTG